MKNESYKIGRNSRCLCGSGKKYKRCCMGKDTIKDMVKNKFEKKVSNLTHLYEMYMKTEKGRDLDRFSDEFSEEKIGKFTFSFKEEEFTNGKPIRFIKRFENLPYELKEKMKVIFQHKPMMDGSCYYNSLYLSTLIDGVEKVDGWIDGKGNPKKYKKYEDLGNGIFLCGWRVWKLSLKERLSNKVFEGGFDKKDRFIYDENTNRRYYKHSWNKYGDIHFDTTLGIDWNLGIKTLDDGGNNRWINYIGLPNTPQPNDDEKKKLLCWCDISSMLDGCKNWVMNRGVLNPMIFEMVGGGVNGGYKSKFKIPFEEERIHQHQVKYLEMGIIT